ncbi:DNA-binding transcriptional MerR regulator [Actinocrispum wychmicini]|uniref:DNA-binding transcriptional MerR regulator n=1 Tax=Actinocrispum wychmicini TaxID=1213861 RepID=A0A4R2JMG0_9PSEU|nr:DNA-binding transcriptional MerR regulator [Actinocrispum wychmicini]
MAKASGVTVRALHYYDQIGLVSAGERTASGHRRYVEADVRRLYRVRALHGLGLTLEEVAAVLRDGAEDLGSLRDLLSAQLADLEIQAGRIKESAQRVQSLLDRLAEAELPAPEQFLATLEPMPVDVGRYLTQAQLATVAERAEELGRDATESLKADWVDVFTRLRRHVLDGTPVEDAEVRALVARWQKIAAAFHTDDPRFETAISALWQDNRAEIGAQLDRRVGWSGPGGTAEVIDYLRRARAARDNEGT